MTKKLIIYLKYWSLKTSNHGLPKIFNSKCTIVALLWTILFLFCIINCIIGIYLDFNQFFQSHTNTNINISNAITGEIPTISMCIDPTIENDSRIIENVYVNNCEFQTSQYLEVEKCSKEHFFRHPNGCLTFNTSFRGNPIWVSDETVDLGLKITFSTNLNIIQAGSVFVIPHELDNMPIEPDYSKRYMALFPCKPFSYNDKTIITYEIEQTTLNKISELPDKNCVDDWSLISNEILINIPSHVIIDMKKYNEETCYYICRKVLLNNIDECSLLCPIKCHFKSYIINEHTKCSDSEKNESIAEVILRYKKVKYVNVDEVPAMTTRQLLGSIGYEFIFKCFFFN